ncbi:carboxypeptidase-like regulatory domain-containing protein [Ochrovirga pacifica]|uniref:carboxypeptidase-like regulatory domain-containing protein n=1 Tax=Ochrovirga pacifica TaxID=1042376 RepID=UPI000255A7B3|nr:carboxypeptidase-like regulatory domain-containing protein [Ochrovirga pacifica]
MNKNYLLILICLLFFSLGHAQDLLKFSLKGKISNAIDSTAIDGTTLLNLTTIDGTVSDKNGLFEIDTQENDTILISHIGFESIKLKITRDLSKGTELDIQLHPKIEQLEEVRVHKLIGVLEIDIKNVPKDKYNRVHINGLPQTYEIRKNNSSVSSLSVGKALTNPVDFVYNLFGKKPKKLRDLKELKEKDATREILTNRFDREIILDYLQMDLNELTEVLSECNYSTFFIQKATDLQLIEAVLECYENHKAIKKGSTSKELKNN